MFGFAPGDDRNLRVGNRMITFKIDKAPTRFQFRKSAINARHPFVYATISRPRICSILKLNRSMQNWLAPVDKIELKLRIFHQQEKTIVWITAAFIQ